MEAIGKLLGWGKDDDTIKVPTAGNRDDTIKLVSFKPHTKLHSSATPFGMKVEVMLRMAGLTYEASHGNLQDTKKISPKEKFPVLYHGPNVVPDSNAIVKYLHNTYPDEMSIFIPKDPKSKAMAHICLCSLQEHTYFGMVYILWQAEPHYKEYGPILLADLPVAVRGVILNMARGKILRDLKGQGMGRHSLEEVREKMTGDFDTFEELLKETGAFLTGSTPTAADCFLWGVLDMCYNSVNVFKDAAILLSFIEGRPATAAFYERIREQVFPNGTSEAWKDTPFDLYSHLQEVASAKVSSVPTQK